LAGTSAYSKPPDIGRDPQRSAWVTSQVDRYGKSCCGLGDGRLVDSRFAPAPDQDDLVWQIKVYRTPDGRGWLFGIPEEAQMLIDPPSVREDPNAPGTGWIDVPHELDTDTISFTGKAFAWWSIAYQRLECFRKPATG
jgi:hypothetical protein